MPNMFPARERKFIAELAAELHLDVSWDEYDDEDQNLVVFRLPGSLKVTGKSPNGGSGAGSAKDEQIDDDGDEAWVDEPEVPEESEESEEDAEALEAVDRVLNKYERAKVVEEEEEDFDVRHERAIQERMDEWKRGYYRVCHSLAYFNNKKLALIGHTGEIRNFI